MKKLIIGAAVVCAAVASQAASFVWKTANYSQFLDPTTKAAITTADGYTAAMNGGSIILVYLADGTYDTATALSSYDTGYLSGDTASFKTSGSASGKYGITATYGFNAGSSNLKDGDKIGVMYKGADGALSQLIYEDGTTIDDVYTIAGLNSADPKNAWSGANFAFGTAGTSDSRTGFTTAVPEPTSAMLLLLGMAGLALKRKHS